MTRRMRGMQALLGAALLALPAVAARAEDEAVAVVPAASPAGAMPVLLGADPGASLPLRAYPETRRDDVVERKFGVAVADPYRWLEDDARSNGDVSAWIAQQNSVTQSYLDALPGRDLLRERMTKLLDHARNGPPRRGGGRYFYTRNSGLQNLSPLYVRDGLEGSERLLVDPNGFSGDVTQALAQWEPSEDGRYLLYAVQEAGSDARTLRVLDVDSGETLVDRIERVRFSGLAWRQDGRGFFYSRYASGSDEDGGQQVLLDHRIYYHALGTAQDADLEVFATPGRPGLRHDARVTDDGRWLLISSGRGAGDESELSVLSLTHDNAVPRRLGSGLSGHWSFAGAQGDRLYFRTDAGAPLGRIMVLDAAKPRRKPLVVVAERERELAGASLVGDRLILAYLVDGRAVAELADLQGKPVGQIQMPGFGTAAGFRGRSGNPETFFRFSDFTTPSSVYRFDVSTGKLSLFAQPALPFDPAAFQTEELSVTSKDGTRVPMYLVRRKDVAAAGKPVPTLLYGYGGFNRSLNPGFSATQLAWVEQGGALAMASLRGGGEFGKAWHDAGRLSRKQNVFDDFIAVAEFLKARGYTGPGQLAIEGRSNGGLLVGAVVNQRPDLFAAALPTVGVMDMLRFDRFTAGRYWIDDYGDPAQESDFHNLLSYSPYHNVAQGRDYPAILVTTADSDDRVVPAHSLKYAAALQHAALGDRPRLLQVEEAAGHGSGRPVDKMIAQAANMYAFIAYWTGLRIGPQ
jgi:prolyl oligopeptidase